MRTHGGEGLPVMRPVAGHLSEVPFWITADMFDGLPCEVAGGPIDHLVGRPVADPHTHAVDEVYLLLSPNRGGARIRVEVDGEQREVTSPAVVHVPAGALHRFLTLEAEPGSCCFGVLMGPESLR